MLLPNESRYKVFMKNYKLSGVVADEMSFYHFSSYMYPSRPSLVTKTETLDGLNIYGSKLSYKSPTEYDYDNYLYNLTETIECPIIERAFSEHLDDVDEDILYHVMQSYRERAVRAQFDSDPKRFWEYDKLVKVPEKLIEVGDFYGTTDRLIFLWNDCWDI